MSNAKLSRNARLMNARLMMGIAALFAAACAASLAVPPTALSAGRPDVQLRLTVEKKTVSTDAAGKSQVTWQALDKSAIVQPGDLLRFAVRGENRSPHPVSGFVVTQPIPAGTVYIPHSAAAPGGAVVTYSADNAGSFAAVPVHPVTEADGSRKLVPAPAASYTHVRWTFTVPLPPAAAVTAFYEAQVH